MIWRRWGCDSSQSYANHFVDAGAFFWFLFLAKQEKELAVSRKTTPKQIEKVKDAGFPLPRGMTEFGEFSGGNLL